MILAGRSLKDISLDDIRALVEDGVREGPDLEYKETAYSGRPQDVREMLRDITALANGQGGYLVMGVEEDGGGRAMALRPIDNPQRAAQAMHQACLDCIRDRIEGLEFQIYDTGFNQGIIVVRVPSSEQSPHMMTRDKRTEFYRRYGTDRRPMTMAEIREMILASPRCRELVELRPRIRRMLTAEQGALGEQVPPHGAQVTDQSEDQAAQPRTVTQPVAGTVPPYAQIITERPVERFLYRYLMGGIAAQAMVIVSPFIGELAGTPFDLQNVTRKAAADRTRLYVITRKPGEPYHEAGVAILQECPLVEIRYNPNIHAKLYVVWSRDEEESYALFGSGNLTEAGLCHNIELGMMIFPRGYGRTILRDLYQWSCYTLRTMSPRVKAIDAIH